LYYPDSRFTFEKIHRLLTLSEAGKSLCQEVRGIMRSCVKENRWRFFHLIVLQRCKEQALARREEAPHVPPCDGTVYHLIESVAKARVED
jgi:hypothetical protein